MVMLTLLSVIKMAIHSNTWRSLVTIMNLCSANTARLTIDWIPRNQNKPVMPNDDNDDRNLTKVGHLTIIIIIIIITITIIISPR